MRDNSILNSLVEEMAGSKGAPDYPYILCKRNEPGFVEDCIHDVGGWEGLRPVVRGSKKKFEIYHDFTLVIRKNKQGELLCFIPETPNNLEKLDRMSVPNERVEVVERRNAVTGKIEKIETKTVTPPVYERLDRNLFEDSALDQLAERLEQKLAERAAKRLEPDTVPSMEDDEDEPVVRERNAGPRKIRTRKISDELLEPIPARRR
jgi:hypothetical protein